jgi:ribosomal protein L12E/L44/L45/RPP1/RPP2
VISRFETFAFCTNATCTATARRRGLLEGEEEEEEEEEEEQEEAEEEEEEEEGAVTPLSRWGAVQVELSCPVA